MRNTRSWLVIITVAATLTASLPKSDPLQCLDARDLVQWRRCTSPDQPLLDNLRARLPDGPEIELRHGFVLFAGGDGDVGAVSGAIDAIRHEAGTRAVARAADARQSLLRDYDGEYGRILVKATWTGEQSEPVPGLAAHGSSRLFEVAPFRAFHRRGIHYGNDELPAFRSFVASELGMEKLVRAVLEHPLCVTAMTRTDAQAWSLSLLDTTGARRPNYVELLLSRTEAREVFAAAAAALDGDAVAREVLDALVVH